MKIGVHEASGRVLDYLVAAARGYGAQYMAQWRMGGDKRYVYCEVMNAPTSHGDLVVSLMEEQGILAGPSAGHRPTGVQWTALRMGVLETESHRMCGPTLRIAVCRCFVASKLGNEVDVPEEMLK